MSTPAEHAEPFGANGADTVPFQPEAQAVEPCKCGAGYGGPDAEGVERCERGHPWRGTHGPAAKHLLYAGLRPDDEPVPDWHSTWPTYRAVVHKHIGALSRWLTERPGRVRSTGHIKTLLDLVRQAREMDHEFDRQAVDDLLSQAAHRLSGIVLREVADRETQLRIVRALRELAPGIALAEVRTDDDGDVQPVEPEEVAP